MGQPVTFLPTAVITRGIMRLIPSPAPATRTRRMVEEVWVGGPRLSVYTYGGQPASNAGLREWHNSRVRLSAEQGGRVDGLPTGETVERPRQGEIGNRQGPPKRNFTKGPPCVLGVGVRCG